MDTSDLDDFEYYKDKRCDEIRELLGENPEYAEYQVVRQHWGSDWKLDPYIIQDEDKVDLIILAPEEVNALSDSELRAYVSVEMKRLDCSEGYVFFLLATTVLTPVAIINSIGVMITYSSLEPIGALVTTLALVLFSILSGAMYYTRRKNMMTNRRQVDLQVAGENPVFLSALRKLAALSSTDEWHGEDYGKRLQYTEEALSGK